MFHFGATVAAAQSRISNTTDLEVQFIGNIDEMRIKSFTPSKDVTCFIAQASMNVNNKFSMSCVVIPTNRIR